MGSGEGGRTGNSSAPLRVGRLAAASGTLASDTTKREPLDWVPWAWWYAKGVQNGHCAGICHCAGQGATPMSSLTHADLHQARSKYLDPISGPEDGDLDCEGQSGAERCWAREQCREAGERCCEQGLRDDMEPSRDGLRREQDLLHNSDRHCKQERWQDLERWDWCRECDQCRESDRRRDSERYFVSGGGADGKSTAGFPQTVPHAVASEAWREGPGTMVPSCL